MFSETSKRDNTAPKHISVLNQITIIKPSLESSFKHSDTKRYSIGCEFQFQTADFQQRSTIFRTPYMPKADTICRDLSPIKFTRLSFDATKTSHLYSSPLLQCVYVLILEFKVYSTLQAMLFRFLHYYDLKTVITDSKTPVPPLYKFTHTHCSSLHDNQQA